MHGETCRATAPHARVKLLPAFTFAGFAGLLFHVPSLGEGSAICFVSQLLAKDVGPSVALEDVPSALGEHDQRAVVADGRNRLDETLIPGVPQVAAMRVERPVTTVAEIAGGHDAEGADSRESADLGAA